MRTLLAAALVAVLTAAGCVSAPITWPDDKPSKDAQAARDAKAASAPKKTPTVKPDSVNPNNAYKAVEALQAELDADAQPPMPPAEPLPAKGKSASRDK